MSLLPILMAPSGGLSPIVFSWSYCSREEARALLLSLFYQNVSPVGIRQLLLLSQAKCISMCAGSSKTRVKVNFLLPLGLEVNRDIASLAQEFPKPVK